MKLKLSHSNTVMATFHLNNREAKRELAVYNNNNLLPFCTVSTDLGLKLNISLVFRHYSMHCAKTEIARRTVEATRKFRIGWQCKNTANCSPLPIIVHSCALVWYSSAHTRLIDSVLNDAMRIITGCLRLTPMNYLPILAGIQPVELSRQEAILSLAYQNLMNPKHQLHQLMVGPTLYKERDNNLGTLL